MAWLASDVRHLRWSDGIYQGQNPHHLGAQHRLADATPTPGTSSSPATWWRRPPTRYSLRKRGRLAAGMAAAMCVLGPGGVTARAINEAPWVMATGVELVIVNGVII